MSHIAPARLGFLAALLLAACARPDAARTERKDSTTASAGDVSAPAPAAAARMTAGLTDSISTRADRGRIRGNEAASLWIVEISDFQCPFCKQWHDQTFATIDKEFVQTGKARMAYLNYPIPSLHPNAMAASEAAMCAAVQGKFWELHDALFEQQNKWAKEKDPMPIFASFAVSAGVDPKNWNACMTSHAAKPLIDADQQRSSASGVQSTPTFFVGTRKILGAYPVDTFRVVINEELAKLAKPAR